MAWLGWADRLMGALESETHGFGEPAVLIPAPGRPRAGEEVALSAVFDEAYELVDPGEGPGMASTAPVATLRDASLAAAGVTPARHDGFRIRGRDYVVAEPPHTDGHAGQMLILREA
jgi:hypothetical protein